MSFINSHTYEAELVLTIKVTKKPEVLLLPAGTYRGDLKITNSKGKDMILLSDSEYERTHGHSMKQLNEKYLERIYPHLTKLQKKILLKNHRVIAILLNNNDDEYYEKIRMKWITKFPNKKQYGLNEYIEVPIFFQRYGFYDSSAAAIYLSIKTSDKYVIMEGLAFRDLLSKKIPKPAIILNDAHHKIYRLSETDIPQFISTSIKISITTEKIFWARNSFLAAILVPFIIVSLLLQYHKAPPYSFEILSGLIALLLGERAFILQDLNLMNRWNSAHLLAIAWCSFMLLLVFIIG